MNCTIIGASGFIGSHLARKLAAAGHTIYAPDKRDDIHPTRDLGTVYYCAGYTADYARSPAATVEAHAGLLARLVEKGKYESLVYLSSTRLYDHLGTGTAIEDHSLHLDPAQPRHLFDISKVLGENICINYSSGRAKIARISSVYSNEMVEDNFLSTLTTRVLKGGLVTVDSSPMLERDYIHVDDVVRAMVAIAETDNSRMFNVAGGENIRNSEIFAIAEKVTGCQIQAVRAEASNSPIIDINRLRVECGIEPTPFSAKFEEILETLAVKIRN